MEEAAANNADLAFCSFLFCPSPRPPMLFFCFPVSFFLALPAVSAALPLTLLP
jgi:hypothetical protein